MADPGAGAVEEHTLVAVADVEQLTDLGRGASDEIAERDHGALLVRELLCNARASSATHRGMALHPQRVRDDRLMPETRWAALIVFFILLPATAILWVAPDRTGDLWAWMIQPELTPIFLGSSYGAGAYFFWRTYRAERWHPSSPG